MKRRPRVFLDTSVLFAALLSPTGGSRLLLKLAEAEAIDMVIGPCIIAEVDGVVVRKAADLRPQLALLLDRARVAVGPNASGAHRAVACAVVDYEPDAHVLAEAIAAAADRFVTLDRKHFLKRRDLAGLPLTVEAPGDCLSWLRRRLADRDQSR